MSGYRNCRYLHDIDVILVKYRCDIDTILMQYQYDFDAISMRYWYDIDAISIRYWCDIDAILIQYWCYIAAHFLYPALHVPVWRGRGCCSPCARWAGCWPAFGPGSIFAPDHGRWAAASCAAAADPAPPPPAAGTARNSCNTRPPSWICRLQCSLMYCIR